MLEPTYASYEVVFGTTPEVLAYDPSVAGFSGINSTNWPTKLIDTGRQRSVAPLGVWNASTDPNGYNEIFSLMLEGMLYEGRDVRRSTRTSTPARPAATRSRLPGRRSTSTSPRPRTCFPPTSSRR